MFSKSKSKSDIIGTFLGSSKDPVDVTQKGAGAPSEALPADEILGILRERDAVDIRELLETLGGSVQVNLDAISQLETYGLVERDKDDAGHAILKIPGK